MITSIKSPLVVGYKGEIGSFILQGLLRLMSKASNIWCFDINETEKEKLDRIKKADVIFLCVPIQDTFKWFCKYKKFLKNKIIIEQTSLKSFLYKGKRKIIYSDNNFTILSMHILFRPSSTPNRIDRKVALLKNNKFYWRPMQDDISQITNSPIVWFNNYEEHDKAMGVQQSLTHRILLVLGNMINDYKNPTYIGNKVLELTERIKSGESILYSRIQANKHLPKILKEFNKNLLNFKHKK